MHILPKFVFLYVVYCLANRREGLNTLAKPYVSPILNLIKKHHESRESRLNLQAVKSTIQPPKDSTTPLRIPESYELNGTYVTTISASSNITNTTTSNVTLSGYEKVLASARAVFPHLDYEGHENFLIWLYNDSINCDLHGRRAPHRRYFTPRPMKFEELMSTPFYIPESHIYYYHYLKQLDEHINKSEHFTFFPNYPTPRRKSTTTLSPTTA